MAVDVMLGMLSAGDDLEFLLAEFPELSRQDWLAAVAYARELVTAVPPATAQAA